MTQPKKLGGFVLLGCWVLTGFAGFYTFWILAFLDIVIVSTFFMRRPGPILGVVFSLILNAAIFFTGAFVLCAHKWNVLGVRGTWSEHAIRNHIGLGVAVATVILMPYYVFYVIYFIAAMRTPGFGI